MRVSENRQVSKNLSDTANPQLLRPSRTFPLTFGKLERRHFQFETHSALLPRGRLITDLNDWFNYVHR
jgi:hypothetical protein